MNEIRNANPVETEQEGQNPASEETDDDILQEARDRYTSCINAESDNRSKALDDLNFLAGEQWPLQAKQARAVEGRPCLTINKLPTFLHQVTNDQRMNKPSIKVHPVDDDADIKTAEVIQGLIRHIEYDSNADVAYDTAVNCAAANGFGYLRLVTEYESDKSFDQKIMFKRVRNPLSVHIDPLSQEPDGCDMKYGFVDSLEDRKEFQKQYPDAKANNTDLVGQDMYKGWFTENTVLVTEYYRIKEIPDTLCLCVDGQVHWKSELPKGTDKGYVVKERKSNRCEVQWFKITGADVLERTIIACKWIPLFPVYGDEIDIEGKVIRSGLVRNAKDPAQMYNYWMHQSLDTPIATPDGWSTIGDLKVGDKVFADTGEQSTVIGKSPVYIGKDCYRVSFGDGSSVVASAEHPWVVEERGKRTAKGFAWVTKKLRTDELDPKQHCIKPAGPLHLPKAKLPLDPYALGVWLGDGSSASGTISASADDIEWMRDLLANRGLKVGEARNLDRSPCFTVFGITSVLRDLGVLNNKHIPAMYLRASVEQRLELLRGLMDTDGNAHSSGQCVFTQANEKFVEQFRELAASLGIKTGAHRRAGRVSKLANGQEIVSGGCTQVSFTPSEGMAVFAMPRKLEKQTRSRRRMVRRSHHKIVSVERIESVPVQCIGIDAPSHLYLCGHSMIPTHNTSATEEVSLRPKTPFIMAEGQDEGYEAQWATANTRSYSSLFYKPVTIDGQLAPPPARQPMADVPAGVLAMAMHASDNIKATTGLFDSSLGARSTATSGKQEIAQQRQGDISNFHYVDNLNRTVRHIGRCLISMIPNYYDGERMVRILGEDETAEAVKVNAPYQVKNPKVEGGVETVLHDLTVGTYDVTVSSGPSYSTLRQEAVDGMIQTGNAWPELWKIAGDKMVKAMDWPGAEEIAERIRRTVPPEIRGNDEDAKDSADPMVPTPEGPVPMSQVPQLIAQFTQALKNADAMLQKAEIGKQEIQRVELAIKAQEAETRRMEAETSRMAAQAQAVSESKETESKAQAVVVKAQADAEAVLVQAQANAKKMLEEAAAAKAIADSQVKPEIREMVITAPSGQVYSIGLK